MCRNERGKKQHSIKVYVEKKHGCKWRKSTNNKRPPDRDGKICLIYVLIIDMSDFMKAGRMKHISIYIELVDKTRR
ncbi:hypothetical protein KDH_11520 [Dictyobacter sp. S3.2.2.5]|uniref:GGDEF domain-containing protein n=1 Tax=Dictyobacter halimunensis TaxID=3026934 RepID=A0ABQ6FL31_9CHLR|nr:hypothetical protein KDH_11520 [Dictyobacter sp. S3.2.2.5]